MTGQAFPSVDYGALAPVLIVLGGACVSVLLEALLPLRVRGRAQLGLTLTVVAAALVAVIVRATSGAAPVSTLAGALAVDGPALFLWGTLLALAVPSVLLLADRSVEPGGAFLADPVALGEAEAAEQRVAVGARTGGSSSARSSSGGGGRTGRSGRGLGAGRPPSRARARSTPSCSSRSAGCSSSAPPTTC